MSKPTVLFLYTELAGYLEACIHELVSRDILVHIVRWPVNKEAPFQFSFPEEVKIYDRSEWNEKLVELSKELKPDLILCSGWVDKEYLDVCRHWRGRIPTVLLLDNQWTGNLKQRLACLAATWMIKPRFSHAWVPGAPQKRFAQNLGFKADRIRLGFYCADLNRFNVAMLEAEASKAEQFPKKLLYVGRYLPFKGIEMLWDAFEELRAEDCSDWELVCLGTGDLWEQRRQTEGITHVGFVQPDELPKYLKETGVFVLPSLKEPWGVVVQEMAAAGFPIVCSDTVGAASAFVKEGLNGYVFQSGSKESLKKALHTIMRKEDDSLQSMGKESHRIAQTINPELWADTLIELL